MERMSQADWKLRAATNTLAVLTMMADNGHAARVTTRTTLTTAPHFQPSHLAMGFPSNTKCGVATQVLRKSAPREKTKIASIMKYSRLAKGTDSSMASW